MVDKKTVDPKTEEIKKDQGDGLRRPVMYAKLRDDINPQSGYSRELVNHKLEKQYWDNMDARVPNPKYPDHKTFLDYFSMRAKEWKDHAFLGSRAPLGPDEEVKEEGAPRFGKYVWKTWGEVETLAQ